MAKRFISGIGILVLAALLIQFGLNRWIYFQLPRLLNQKNKTDYHIEYTNLKVDLFKSSIRADSIRIVPKQIDTTQNKPEIRALIHSIEINRFSIWALLTKNHIVAQTIHITKPEVGIQTHSDRLTNRQKNLQNRIIAPFDQIIRVSGIRLTEGKIYAGNRDNGTSTLYLENLNISLDGLIISKETLKNQIPFTYKGYSIDCDSAFYLSDSLNSLATRRVHVTDKELEVRNFVMRPRFPRKQIVRNLLREKDIFDLEAGSVSFKNLDWGFRDSVFFVDSKSVLLDGVKSVIYRNKLPPDDTRFKPLFGKMLRDLPFHLRVDSVKISNSSIIYEEERALSTRAGKLTFDRMNATITSVYGGKSQNTNTEVSINVDTRIMGVSPVSAYWTFRISDPRDSFRIRGKVSDLDMARLTPFLKPYYNATTSGKLRSVYFNLAGDNRRANGDFAVSYDHLKVKIYKKDNPSEVHRLKTIFGNLMLKDDSNGELKTATVEVERLQDKGFFNLLWRCIAQGLKSTLT